MVAIINYGMGNLRSVMNALLALDCPVMIAHAPADLAEADKIVLPGVGAFGDGMQHLQSGGWLEALETEVRQKRKPFLGICLGMQLLGSKGYELGEHEGLDWIPGSVDRLTVEDPDLRIPHIGWNDVCFTRTEGLYAGLGERQTFYFVHSYVLCPQDPRVISGLCTHGTPFAASLEWENIRATQFHPEKSQKAGIAVLRNFVRLRE